MLWETARVVQKHVAVTPLLSLQPFIPFHENQKVNSKGKERNVYYQTALPRLNVFGLIPSAKAQYILTFLIYFWKLVLPTLALTLILAMKIHGYFVFYNVHSFFLMSITFTRI